MIVTADETGRIVIVANAGYPAPENEVNGHKAANPTMTVTEIPPVSPDYWHVVNGAPAIRPRMELQPPPESVLANGEAVATISGIPAGATYRVTGNSLVPEASGAVDDGSLELTFASPGIYTILIELFPYQPERFAITAQPTGGGPG